MNPRSIWQTVLGLSAFAIFVSCQTQASVDASSTSAMDVYLPVKANRIHPPDSLQSFKSPADSGMGIRGSLAADSNYQVTMHLSRPLGTDILKFHYTSLGLFVFSANCKQSGTETKLIVESTDTTASEKRSLKLLVDFDSARTDAPAAHSKLTDPVAIQIADLRAFYATQLLQGNLAYAGFPANLPAGLDTVGLRDKVLALAVASGKTLSQLARTWILDLDSAQARAAIVDLVAKGAITDTSKVFPLPAVRLKHAVSVTPNSVVAGVRASLSGSFAWNPGPLPVISSSVLRNGVAATGVRVLSSANLSPSDTSLSLANAYIVDVDASADTGAYTLVIQLSLGGDVARSETRFVVAAAPKNVDLVPPALSIVSPSKDTSVPNATSSLVVVATASDSSGIDSVEIGNQKLTSAPYSASVDLAVGPDTILVQAWDKSGNKSTRTVVATRAKSPGDTTKPVIKPVAPLNDTTVDNSTTSLPLSWVVTDDSLLAKFTLNDTALNSATGLYSKTVNLSVGKNIFVLCAYDARGNTKLDTLIVTRQALVDLVPPSLAITSPSKDTSVPNATSSVVVTATATDASGIDSVKIGNQKLTAAPYSASVDLAVGPDSILVQAWDKAKNRSTKTVVVTRAKAFVDTSKPAFVRGSGTKDTVLLASQASITLAWTVSDNALKTVSIGGTVVGGVSGVYSRDIRVVDDSAWVVMVATDSFGNAAKDSVKIRRLANPAISPNGAEYSGSQTGQVAISSNQPGASLFYSTDNKNWAAYGGLIAVSKSMTIFAQAKLGSVVSPIDSATFLYTPTFSQPSGPYSGNFVLAISAPGATIEDSLSTGTSWTKSSGTMTLTTSVTVYARARLGNQVSQTVAATYAFAPIVTPTSASDSESTNVSLLASGVDSVEISTDSTIWKRVSASTLPITSSGKLFARAWTKGILSGVSTGIYHIFPKMPSLTPLPGGYASSQYIALASPTGAAMQYSLDGGSSWSNWVGTNITIGTSSTLKIRAIKTGMDTTSATANYTIHNEIPWGPGGLFGTVRDPRDGQAYRTTQIGGQIWMANNLNYAGSGASSIGTCKPDTIDYCGKYGRLYMWTEALGLPATDTNQLLNATDTDLSTDSAPIPVRQGICPAGWHVPSNGDWDELNSFLSGTNRTCADLEALGGWSSNVDRGGNPYTRTDIEGFRVMAGAAVFWHASEAGAYGGVNNAWYTYFDGMGSCPSRYYMPKNQSLNLRCVKNGL